MQENGVPQKRLILQDIVSETVKEKDGSIREKTMLELRIYNCVNRRFSSTKFFDIRIDYERFIENLEKTNFQKFDINAQNKTTRILSVKFYTNGDKHHKYHLEKLMRSIYEVERSTYWFTDMNYIETTEYYKAFRRVRILGNFMQDTTELRTYETVKVKSKKYGMLELKTPYNLQEWIRAGQAQIEGDKLAYNFTDDEKSNLQLIAKSATNKLRINGKSYDVEQYVFTIDVRDDDDSGELPVCTKIDIVAPNISCFVQHIILHWGYIQYKLIDIKFQNKTADRRFIMVQKYNEGFRNVSASLVSLTDNIDPDIYTEVQNVNLKI